MCDFSKLGGREFKDLINELKNVDKKNFSSLSDFFQPNPNLTKLIKALQKKIDATAKDRIKLIKTLKAEALPENLKNLIDEVEDTLLGVNFFLGGAISNLLYVGVSESLSHHEHYEAWHSNYKESLHNLQSKITPFINQVDHEHNKPIATGNNTQQSQPHPNPTPDPALE